MKKSICVILTLLMLLPVVCSCSRAPKQTLKVYSAGEYIDEALIYMFENEYNCKIVYETFDSNESMYTKICSGERYDILVPSDYMIERLIKEDFLQPVDKELIPNAENVMPSIMEHDEYDENHTYSMPYFWGTVGILYDKTKVSEEDIKKGWEILRDPKFKNEVYMYDSERDSFMVALKALGYSMNTENTAEYDEAYNWLVEQKDLVNPVYAGDDVIDAMISGEKHLAVVYSGDAAYIMTENEDLGFFQPDEGTNVWYDAMVITKDCVNTELANKYINFMLDENNAYDNSLFVGYSSPVETAFNELKEDVYSENNAYDPLIRKNDEVFGYQTPQIKQYCAELWIKVKAK